MRLQLVKAEAWETEDRDEHGEWTSGGDEHGNTPSVDRSTDPVAWAMSDKPSTDLYEAEGSVRDSVGAGQKFDSVAQADQYANEAWERNADLWQGSGTRPDFIDVRAGTLGANSSGMQYVLQEGRFVTPVIQLGSNMRDQLTVVHEMAHALFGPGQQAEENHGPDFQRVYGQLLQREMPDHASALSGHLAGKCVTGAQGRLSRFTLIKATPRLRLVKWGDSWEDQDRDEQGRWEGTGSSVSGTASSMIDAARAAEPATTAALRDVSSNASGQMIGLEHAVKGQDSLERKIAEKQSEAPPGTTRTPGEAGALIHDDLRYTMTFSKENYTEGVKAAVDDLKSKGYSFDEGRVKNSWESNGYRGLNTTVKTPEGKTFELQFHTPESFDTKEQMHTAYEEERLQETTPDRKAELRQQMSVLSDALGPSPEGASSLTPKRIAG